jgi:hypothetical protein
LINSKKVRLEEGIVIFSNAIKDSKITFDMIREDAIEAKNQINAFSP